MGFELGLIYSGLGVMIGLIISKYRIYSIDRPVRLLTFPAFRMGAYSRWALIRGLALIRINTVVTKSLKIQRLNFFLRKKKQTEDTEKLQKDLHPRECYSLLSKL